MIVTALSCVWRTCSYQRYSDIYAAAKLQVEKSTSLHNTEFRLLPPGGHVIGPTTICLPNFNFIESPSFSASRFSSAFPPLRSPRHGIAETSSQSQHRSAEPRRSKGGATRQTGFRDSHFRRGHDTVDDAFQRIHGEAMWIALENQLGQMLTGDGGRLPPSTRHGRRPPR